MHNYSNALHFNSSQQQLSPSRDVLSKHVHGYKGSHPKSLCYDRNVQQNEFISSQIYNDPNRVQRHADLNLNMRSPLFHEFHYKKIAEPQYQIVQYSNQLPTSNESKSQHQRSVQADSLDIFQQNYQQRLRNFAYSKQGNNLMNYDSSATTTTTNNTNTNQNRGARIHVSLANLSDSQLKNKDLMNMLSERNTQTTKSHQHIQANPQRQQYEEQTRQNGGIPMQPTQISENNSLNPQQNQAPSFFERESVQQAKLKNPASPMSHQMPIQQSSLQFERGNNSQMQGQQQYNQNPQQNGYGQEDSHKPYPEGAQSVEMAEQQQQQEQQQQLQKYASPEMLNDRTMRRMYNPIVSKISAIYEPRYGVDVTWDKYNREQFRNWENKSNHYNGIVRQKNHELGQFAEYSTGNQAYGQRS